MQLFYTVDSSDPRLGSLSPSLYFSEMTDLALSKEWFIPLQLCWFLYIRLKLISLMLFQGHSDHHSRA